MLAGMGVGIQDVEMEVPGDRGCVPLDVLLERTPGTRRGSALSSSADTVGYAVSSRSGSSASGPVNPPAVSTGSVTNKLRKGSRKKCKPLECSQEGPTPSCSSAASLGASATPSTPGGAVTRKKASRRKSEKKSAKETRKRRSGWLLVNHNSNKSWRKILWKDMHVRAQSTGIWLCEDKDTEVPVAVCRFFLRTRSSRGRCHSALPNVLYTPPPSSGKWVCKCVWKRQRIKRSIIQ